MPYGKEDTDYKVDGDPSSGFIFNAADSVFWRRIRKLMYSQLQNLYLNRESAGCWSASSLITEFDNWQSMFPEELWRLDIERKYIRTYQAGTIRFLNEMMNGRKKYQRRQFERDMEAYIGTKYVSTAVRADQIMFRCNTPKSAVVSPDYTLKIVPYSDMYITVLYGNSPSPQQKRAKAGQEYTLTTALTEMDDTAILIYCASRIQALNDLSACYIHDNDFSKASRLRTLIIGNTTEGYSNSFLTTLNMGNNTLLQTLDVRNCPNLTGAVNLSACPNLATLYAEGTSLTSVTFATNGKIAKAHLPETINTLTLRSLNYLTDLNVASYDNLETYVNEYSIVDSLPILNEAIDTLQIVRILGIDWQLPSTTLLNNIIKKNTAVLAGKVYIAGPIRYKEINDYAAKWPDLTVTYEPENLVTQYLITFVNYDGTVLGTQYVDRGALPYDPVEAGDFEAPSKPHDSQYDYTYNGWDDITSPVLAPRTITATYTGTTRVYTVTWYARMGVPLATTQVEYGSEAIYPNDIPVYTDEEASYTYNVFLGWDKSTGFVTDTTNVYALWDRKSLPATDTDIKDMSIAELYGVAVSGNADTYATPKDYVDITVGNDFNFSNVESEVLIENTWFNGSTAIDTDIKLFNADAESFTMAIDFEFFNISSNATNATLVSCYDESGSEGFRLRYNGAPNIQWGDKNGNVGYGSQRGMCVLRHIKGSDTLYVYASNIGAASLDDDITTYELKRSRNTSTESQLVFGAFKSLEDGGYDYYASGWIYQCKIWHQDLGNIVARELAAWPHETWRAEYYGGGRYRTTGSKRTNMSFIFNNALPGHRMSNSTSSNAGGWNGSLLRTAAMERVRKILPIPYRAIIQQSRVPTTSGGMSSEIVISQDYIFVPSYIEMVSNNDTQISPYVEEGSLIPWFTNESTRLKFNRRIVPDTSKVFTSSEDPTTNTSNNVTAGDIWFNNSVGYIYIPAADLAKHNYTGTNTGSHIAAYDGGLWYQGMAYWTRSAAFNYNSYFHFISNSGSPSFNIPYSDYGIVPCFSI